MNKNTLIIADRTTILDDVRQYITDVVIQDSVTEIGHGAFYGCSSLKSIYIDKERGSLDLSGTGIPKACKVYWRGEFNEVKE